MTRIQSSYFYFETMSHQKGRTGGQQRRSGPGRETRRTVPVGEETPPVGRKAPQGRNGRAAPKERPTGIGKERNVDHVGRSSRAPKPNGVQNRNHNGIPRRWALISKTLRCFQLLIGDDFFCKLNHRTNWTKAKTKRPERPNESDCSRRKRSSSRR